jgi:hypothetical protein
VTDRYFRKTDRDVRRRAHYAGSAVVVKVASQGLEQKEKLLGQHGGSPVTAWSPAIIAGYAESRSQLVINLTFRKPLSPWLRMNDRAAPEGGLTQGTRQATKQEKSPGTRRGFLSGRQRPDGDPINISGTARSACPES